MWSELAEYVEFAAWHGVEVGGLTLALNVSEVSKVGWEYWRLRAQLIAWPRQTKGHDASRNQLSMVQRWREWEFLRRTMWQVGQRRETESFLG